jgi:DNA repair protein RecN (Recombination protein N)
MQASEKLRGDVARAAALLDETVGAGAREVQRLLDPIAARLDGALDEALAALARATIELDEAEAGVEHALRAMDFEPAELEAVEERLFAIRALARKHGVLPDDLGAHAEALRARLSAIDLGAEGIARLRATCAAAEAGYAEAAARLTALRILASARLDHAMAVELPPLKLDRARFETRIGAGEPGPEGVDAVSFTVATNPGAPAGPLDRIASGGELSRFLLALKVCLTGAAPGQTLIFDEIDRGVGGATADAVGRRLRALAEGAQVLVVTHSPQVAAKGAAHWRVEKRQTAQETLSTVTALDPLARVEEIARMLAGEEVTDDARAAARALIG